MALDAKMLTMQKRGYVSSFDFVIYTTAADQRIGHASIDVTFMPADELIQLKAYVGIKRS